MESVKNIQIPYISPMKFQEFGGNYYQPMIKYIHSKEILGPYQEREEIYMPDKCEVISDKYSNM